MSQQNQDDILVIEAGRSEKQYWRDLWRYRELFYFLAWRDLLVRYKQTVIGIAWSVLRPLLTMIVFTFVFGQLAKLPSEGVPYSLLVFSAMLPWQFFSNALSETSSSLINNSNLISKVYFPRLIIPTSAMMVGLVDFFISLGLLAVLMAWYHLLPTWKILALPFFIFMVVLLSTGMGIWISALNVKFRDFRYVIPFMVQLGLYISPIGFSSTIIPEQWRILYYLNPMVGIIDGFRWALLPGKTHLYSIEIILSLVIILVLFVTGLRYFRQTERSFADII